MTEKENFLNSCHDDDLLRLHEERVARENSMRHYREQQTAEDKANRMSLSDVLWAILGVPMFIIVWLISSALWLIPTVIAFVIAGAILRHRISRPGPGGERSESARGALDEVQHHHGVHVPCGIQRPANYAERVLDGARDRLLCGYGGTGAGLTRAPGAGARRWRTRRPWRRRGRQWR